MRISDWSSDVCSSDLAPDSVEVENILFDLEAKIVRGQILNGEPRIDGRDTRTVRPISVSLGVLPRAHGSALFTRGETQALVVATLGRSEEHTSELQSLMRISYAVFCLKKKNKQI